jgi:hypothetical protein
LDGDEPDLLEKPIVKQYEHDPDAFFTLYSFDIDHFRRLFDDIEAQITVPARDRRPVIGAKDFLFLHWLRSANQIGQITAHFNLRSPTLHKHLDKLALAGQNPLVTNYIVALRQWPLSVTGSDDRSYGLIVDATVQKRGRPVASFVEARR